MLFKLETGNPEGFTLFGLKTVFSMSRYPYGTPRDCRVPTSYFKCSWENRSVVQSWNCSYLRCLVICPETKHIWNCMGAEYGRWEDKFAFHSPRPLPFSITLHSDGSSCSNFSLCRIPHKPFPWWWRAAYDSLADMVSLWTKSILWYFYKMNGDTEAFWKMLRAAQDTVLVQRNPGDCNMKKLSLTFGLWCWHRVCDRFSKWLLQITDLANVVPPTISLCFL